MRKVSTNLCVLKRILDVFVAGVFFTILLLMWTLYKGPVSVPYLKPYIIQALNYDESEYEVGLGAVNLELVRSIQPLRITADDISLKKKDGSIAINSPKLYMSFSLRALLKGIIAPSDISMENPTAYIFANYGVEKEHINEANKIKLEFYVEKFKDFLNKYNSAEKIYPESYVNNIIIHNGELEFHEVDLGRKFMLSDLNLEFSRNYVNLELNANALVNINEKIASIGFESEYHADSDKLDLEVYFSDLILSDVLNSFVSSKEDSVLSQMRIEVPVNGKVNTTIALSEIMRQPKKIEQYLSSSIEKIKFEVDGGHGYVAFDTEQKNNYEIDEVVLSGELNGGIDELKITNADFKMGGQNAQISFNAKGLESYYLTQSLEKVSMQFSAKINEFPLDVLSRFWPRYLAEPAWQWCKEGLSGGLAKNAEFTFDFGYDKSQKSWGMLNLSGEANLEDGNLFYLEGMPFVRNVYGKAYFSPQNISIDVDKGVTEGVIITGGNVNIYDLDKEDNFISINLIGNSTITDALNLINNKPLEFAKEMGINPSQIQGNVDVKLGLDFELRQDLDAKDIEVNVEADLYNISTKNLIPGHTVSAENMILKVNSKGWSLDGNANYDELPIKLAINEKFAEKKYKSRSHISFKFDEKAKKILGVDWDILKAPYIDGHSMVEADIVVKENDEVDINLTADFQDAEIDYSFLGFVKEAGEPTKAEAHIIVAEEKVKTIESISLQKLGFLIKGNVDMHASGRVKTIDITKIKGPKTSARAKISLSDTEKPHVKVDVTGTSYDLSPLFERKEKKRNEGKLPVQEDDDAGLEKTNDVDIYISVNSLWTNKSTPIKNFAGSAKLRNGIGLDEMHMVGNHGIDKSIKLKLDYVPRGNKEHFLSIDSNNAGSTLKVLRFYDNMVGGTLRIEARRLANRKFIGHLSVRDFSIQNAPVVAKLLTVASLTGMLDLLKGDGLTFSHFNAPFEYHNKILQLKQAKAEGNVVGITVGGTYNRATDNIKMEGVIAPAYSINRFLGKLPVFGNLLASRDGTIFAANYQINGNGSNAKIDINTLSMLSPNSLKEWYGDNFGKGSISEK